MKKLGIDLAMRIASEHLSYRSLIAEIEGDLEERRAEASAEGLQRLLRSFYTDVRSHFALEEKGGLFEVYRENDHTFQKKVASLLAQHRDLLARLRRVLELASALDSLEGPGFESFEREFRALAGDLRAHEQAEDALLERLVDQDIRR